MKRAYTAEQQADLDIKTSVNKIGEIVNLSQVLNSLYWDQYHHGKTHEELHELYCDVSTLDVMSNLEIDKAKKEFSISNSEELNLIRTKYEDVLTTEEDRHILPAFFAHIARLKGYYNPAKKAYLQHDTAMDYLQRIVKRFRTKNKLQNPTSLLSDIFDTRLYRSSNVSKKQISHIMKHVKKYAVDVAKLYEDREHIDDSMYIDDGMSRREKRLMLFEQLTNYVKQYRLGYSTMIFLIKSLERKEYRRYRNIMLPLLFTVCRKSFLDAVVESKKDIEVLLDGGTDIFLYDIGLRITKNG